jgi:manganese/zinc/iron transport system substrate-binding protein
MKSFVLIFLSIIAFGCSAPKKPPRDGSGKLRVLSTTAMIGDIVEKVGGERVESDVLILSGIDPHSYELVRGDNEKIEEAVILFANGLGLEHGASLQQKVLTHAHKVLVGDYVLKSYPEKTLYDDGQIDPHIWMDVSLWAQIVDPIIEALIIADPEGSEYYKQRGAFVKEEMLLFHEELKRKLGTVSVDRRYLVTSHDAFYYFTRAYLSAENEIESGLWKKRFMAPEGLAPDGQLGLLNLKEVIDHLVENKIEVVFPESNVSRDSLNKIVLACKEKKKFIRFSQDTLYGDCMGVSGSLEGTYLGMLAHNGDVLLKEWKEN